MFQVFLVMLAVALNGAGNGPMSVAAPDPGPSEAPTDTGTALVAEPQVPLGKFTTATEVRPILNATKGNWVAVRDWDGQDLIYVTHLWSWRCGLVQMKVAINDAPAEVWPLPDCHMDLAMPSSILEQDGPPYRAFPAGSVQSISVHVTYDDLGTDMATFQRSDIQIP